MKRDDALPRGMQISGDAETAQVFSRLLKNADLDWEELLAQRIGDVAAQQIGNAVRGFAALEPGCGVASGTRHGGVPALREPRSAAAPRGGGFLAGVDQLRDDAERLNARLKRAEHKARRP